MAEPPILVADLAPGIRAAGYRPQMMLVIALAHTTALQVFPDAVQAYGVPVAEGARHGRPVGADPLKADHTRVALSKDRRRPLKC